MDSTEYPPLDEDLVDAECWATGYGDGASIHCRTPGKDFCFVDTTHREGRAVYSEFLLSTSTLVFVV